MSRPVKAPDGLPAWGWNNSDNLIQSECVLPVCDWPLFLGDLHLPFCMRGTNTQWHTVTLWEICQMMSDDVRCLRYPPQVQGQTGDSTCTRAMGASSLHRREGWALRTGHPHFAAADGRSPAPDGGGETASLRNLGSGTSLLLWRVRLLFLLFFSSSFKKIPFLVSTVWSLNKTNCENAMKPHRRWPD